MSKGVKLHKIVKEKYNESMQTPTTTNTTSTTSTRSTTN